MKGRSISSKRTNSPAPWKIKADWNKTSALLELLLSEDRAKRLESEKARIRERLRRINEIIQQQKDVQARTGNGENMQRLSGEQRGIAEKTGKLAKEIGANEEQKKLKVKGGAAKKDRRAARGKGKGKVGAKVGKTISSSPRSRKGPRIRTATKRKRGWKTPNNAWRTREKKLDDAKRRGAVEDQERAIQELERAKAALEEILRQLREEEIERMLAMLEARFRKMLQMEHEVHDGTVRLDSVPPPERTHNHEIESSRLSGKQSEIIVEVDKALLLLKEDGTAVALPAAVAQMREDMEQAAHRLGQGRVDRITQTIEEDVLAALQEIIDALKKAQEGAGEKAGSAGARRAAGSPLIDLLAELKMIRALQLRVNRRTERYSKLIVGEQAEKADLLDALRGWADSNGKYTKSRGTWKWGRTNKTSPDRLAGDFGDDFAGRNVQRIGGRLNVRPPRAAGAGPRAGIGSRRRPRKSARRPWRGWRRPGRNRPSGRGRLPPGLGSRKTQPENSCSTVWPRRLLWAIPGPPACWNFARSRRHRRRCPIRRGCSIRSCRRWSARTYACCTVAGWCRPR